MIVGTGRYLLAVIDQHTGVERGQVQVPGQTNEITAFIPSRSSMLDRRVSLDEFGDVVRSLLGQVVPAVLEDRDVHVGPAVMGSKVLGECRHDRAEDVLTADEQQGDVDRGGVSGVERHVGREGAVDLEG